MTSEKWMSPTTEHSKTDIYIIIANNISLEPTDPSTSNTIYNILVLHTTVIAFDSPISLVAII